SAVLSINCLRSVIFCPFLGCAEPETRVVFATIGYIIVAPKEIPMPLPVPTNIATGFADLSGCSYRLATDQLYVADDGAGQIVAVNPHTHVKTVLGTGYNFPSDLELSRDGLHAYITENPGTLLRASLSNLNRAAATVVASGFNGIDQVA